MKKITSLGYVIFLTILTGTAYCQDIVLNEVLASNQTVNADEDGDYSDWIELYNNSVIPTDLSNFGLSDDPSQPFKWIFPPIIMEPGQYLLVWCSDKNRTDPAQPLHSNFKISADGETLTLTRPDGTIMHQLPPTSLGEDISFGTAEPGSLEYVFFTTPTPAAPNSQTETEMLTPPVISMPSGNYANGFSTTITHPDPGVTILYTLDGSEPQTANIGGHTYEYKNRYRELPSSTDGELLSRSIETLIYTQELAIVDRSTEPNQVAGISTTYHEFPPYFPDQPILKSTVLRAKAVKNGAEPSPTVTRNYFVGETAAAFSLPVVSISADEPALFDYQNGIHVAGLRFDQWRDANPEADAGWSDDNANYQQSGDAWEAKGHFSYHVGASEVLNQDIGLRINGGYNRIHPNKSLRLYARSELGNPNISYPIFGSDYDFSDFKRLILRNAGNDINSTYFRDAFIQRAVQHCNLSTQPYQPAVVFLNGEYWGLLNFRERYDDKYFERVYGVDAGDLDFLEYNGYLVQEGDYSHYADLLGYLEANDLSDDANYNYVITQLDPENFADFYITNIYANNIDWPHNNIEFWRKRTTYYEPDAPYGQDGRWRWVLKDTDFGFGWSSADSYSSNTLAFASSTGGDPIWNPEWSTFVFRKMLDNASFRNYFVNRFADLINTAFLPQRLTELIDEMKGVIEPEIPMHASRWNYFTTESWNANVEVMKTFAIERPAHQRVHLQQKFNIGSQIAATLDVDDPTRGYVSMNTVDIVATTPGVGAAPYPWTGIYFSGVPVTVKAVALPGYEFSHWTGASQSPNAEITLSQNADFSLVAHFTMVNPAPEIPISFWAADVSLPNVPITSISSTYEVANEGHLEFQSCLEGYPFDATHPLWRKASMERINSPTDINYIPEANDNIPFSEANIRGIQIRKPFVSLSSENVLVFHQSTVGYEQILARIAAKNDGAAEAIIVDYSITEPPLWITEGLTDTTLELSNEYQLFEIDFSSIPSVNDNANFKFRMRFAGTGLELEDSGRVVFNNISISGKQVLEVSEAGAPRFNIYPNPASEVIYIAHDQQTLSYSLFAIDGRLVQHGEVLSQQIDLGAISNGIYVLRLESENGSYSHKIVKEAK